MNNSINEKIKATYLATESLLILGINPDHSIFTMLNLLKNNYNKIKEDYQKLESEIKGL